VIARVRAFGLSPRESQSVLRVIGLDAVDLGGWASLAVLVAGGFWVALWLAWIAWRLAGWIARWTAAHGHRQTEHREPGTSL
jgi:hypothetical protein